MKRLRRYGSHPRISIHALRKESDCSALVRRMIEDKFQSTLSVRRATVAWRDARLVVMISIHALRKESDDHKTVHTLAFVGISIHALRKESDHTKNNNNTKNAISIHALRKESDHKRADSSQWPIHFNPRSP